MSPALRSTETVSLKDVAVLNPPTPRLSPTEGVAFVPMASVSEEGWMTAEAASVANLKPGFSYFQNGDVLVAKITPCYENNKVAVASFVQQHGFGSTEFHVLRPTSGALDSNYLVHYLRQNSIRRAGEQRMTGSGGQRRVPRQFLEELPVPLPPLNAQRRIAAILDRADDLRRKRRAALENLDRLRASNFEALFGNPVSNDLGFDRVSFGQLTEAIQSGWSPVCLDRPAEIAEWGVLKLSAVTECEFKEAEQKALPSSICADPSLEIAEGDILFSRKNTKHLVAACALVGQTRPRLIFSDLIYRIRIFSEAKCLPLYLQALLTHPKKRSVIQSLAGGSAGSMPNISKEKLRSVAIELPPIDLQRAFAARVAEIDKLKASHRAHLAQLDALFASLQHRAFRGEL